MYAQQAAGHPPAKSNEEVVREEHQPKRHQPPFLALLFPQFSRAPRHIVTKCLTGCQADGVMRHIPPVGLLRNGQFIRTMGHELTNVLPHLSNEDWSRIAGFIAVYADAIGGRPGFGDLFGLQAVLLGTECIQDQRSSGTERPAGKLGSTHHASFDMSPVTDKQGLALEVVDFLGVAIEIEVRLTPDQVDSVKKEQRNSQWQEQGNE